MADAAASAEPVDPDSVDQANDETERETVIAKLAAEKAKLAEIDAALQRLRNGTYGICVKTGKPISVADLRAMPWRACSREATDRLKPDVANIDAIAGRRILANTMKTTKYTSRTPGEQAGLPPSANKKVKAFGQIDRYLNSKKQDLLMATVLGPEKKPTNSVVRYSLPKQPKVPLGLLLGLVVLIATVVAVYGLFVR